MSQRVSTVIVGIALAAALLLAFQRPLPMMFHDSVQGLRSSFRERDRNRTDANVYRISQLLPRLAGPQGGPVLVVLGPDLDLSTFVYYHSRLLYRAYPLPLDFAVPRFPKALKAFKGFRIEVPSDEPPPHLLWKASFRYPPMSLFLVPVDPSSYASIVAIPGEGTPFPGFETVEAPEDHGFVVYGRRPRDR